MKNKKTVTTVFDFKIQGEKEIRSVMETLKDTSKRHSVRIELDKLASDLVQAENMLKKAMEGGTKNLDRLSLEPMIKKLATAIDRYKGELDKSNIGKNITADIDKEISIVQKKIDNARAKIAEIESKRQQMNRDFRGKIEGGAFGDGVTPDLMEADNLTKKIKNIEKEIQNSTIPSDIKRLESLKEDLLVFLKELKKLRAAEGKLNQQIGGHRGNITRQSKTRDRLLTEKGETIKADIPQADKEALASYERIVELLNSMIENQKQLNNHQIQQEQKKAVALTQKQKKETVKLTQAEKEHEKTLGQKVFSGLSYYVVFQKVKQLLTSSIKTITELDQAMIQAAMVTGMTRKETWGLLESYQVLAQEVGRSTSEIANLNAFFLQQGMSVRNALEMTEVAAKSAAVAGISLQESANYLTSAINGFGLAASAAEEVADKFAAVGAATAANYEELAIAMSKVSPVAQSAGVSIDFMMGILAKGIHTTREAPENIGTAFKTIFARMRELTDIGKATEDGMSLNRVEKALESIGVPLREATGQFRNLEQVLIDVGMKWKDLDSLQQAYLATALAGNRQQPRLMAILNDFDETLEFIEISKDSARAMEFQHMEYMKGMEAATEGLRNSWEQLVTAIVESKAVIVTIRAISLAVKLLSKILSSTIAKIITLVALLTALAVTLHKLKQANIFGLIVRGLKSIQKALVGVFGTIKLIKSSLLTFAIAAAIAAALWGLYKLITRTKRLKEEIKEAQKELYELGKSRQELQKLIDRFEELNSKIVRTQEETEELKEIISELREYDIGDNEVADFTRRNYAGEVAVDYRQLQKHQEQLAAEEEKLQEEVKERLYKLFDRESPTTDKFKKNWEEMSSSWESYLLNWTEKHLVTNTGDEGVKKYLEGFQSVLAVLDPNDFLNEKGRLDFAEMLRGAQDLGKEFAKTQRSIEQISEQSQTQKAEETIRRQHAEYKRLVQAIKDMNFSLSMQSDILSEIEQYYGDIAAQSRLIDLGVDVSNLVRLSQRGVTSQQTSRILEKLGGKVGLKLEELEAVEKEIARLENTDQSEFKGKKKKDREKNKKKQINRAEILRERILASITPEERALFDLGDEFLNEFLSQQNLSKSAQAIKEALQRTGLEYTDDEVQIFLQKLYEDMGSKNAIAISLELEGSATSIKKALEIPEELAKGNIEGYYGMLQEYGLEVFEKFQKTGDFSLLAEASAEQTRESIRDRLNEIQSMDFSNLSEEAANKLQNEKTALEALLTTVDSATYLMHAYAESIQEVNNQISQMSNLNKKIEELLEIGASPEGPLVGLMQGISDGFQADIERTLTNNMQNTFDLFEQSKRELDRLGLIDREGNPFVMDSFTLGDRRKQEEYLEKRKQFSEAVLSLYQFESEKIRQMTDETNKKIRETNQTYKDLIDTLQEFHSERWAAIDYENKLYDLEGNINRAREAYFSAVSAGQGVAGAQIDLRRAQEDRQRAIEDEILRRMTKDLEEQRRAREEELQERLADNTEKIVKNMEKIIEVLQDREPIVVNPTTPEKVTREGHQAPLSGSTGEVDVIKQLWKFT